MRRSLKKLFSEYLKITIVVIVLIVLGTTIYILKYKNTPIIPVAVARGEISEEVEISGKTKPVSSVDLAFDKSGRVAEVKKQIGDSVKTGDQLVILDRSELLASLNQAKANLASESVKLSEMKKGTRVEEINVYQAKVDSAITALSDARNSFADKIVDSYTKADDAVKNYADQFFDKLSTYSFKSQLTRTTNQDTINNLNTKRYIIASLMSGWNLKINSIDDKTDLEKLSDEYQRDLTQVKSFIDLLADVVNSFDSTDTSEQATFSGYRTDMSLARTAINIAIANLSSSEQSYRSASSSLDVAQKDFDLKQAGNTPEAIAAEEAKVASLKAQVDSVYAELSKTVLVSPIDGVVTKQEAKVGELMTSGIIVSSVISDKNLEIEGYVPEVNVRKISVGNSVKVSFDAFPGEEFTEKLAYVEPAETMIDGVVNYKVKISMDNSDGRLKSGLTANLKIVTASKVNALYVPKFAVFQKDGKNFVKKIPNQKDLSDLKEAEVFLGVSSDDGNVEILSGLSFGDYVAVEK